MLLEVFMELHIEYLPISQLKPYEKNARKHTDKDVEAIVSSIREFGFSDPIGIWGENLIVEGHGRLQAAKKLGMDKVPCIRLDHLTDEQRRAYALAHNKTAELSAWDTDLLGSELADIFDIDMEEFGFPALKGPTKEEGEIPEPPAEPVTQRGDLWQLGSHRLLCGDATSLTDVEKLMGGAKADLFLTDPPYNIDYTGKTKDALKIQGDKQSDEDFRKFLTKSFMVAKAVLKPGAAFYIWHADSEGYNFRGAVKDSGLQLRQTLIWAKNVFTLGRQDYQWSREPCLYGWADGAGHSWYSDRRQQTILNFDRPTKSKEHPTMKPVPLFDYLMRNSTKTGDLVLDTFGGSGTTIIAAEQNGRIGYCTELDPRYCDVIVQRWENLTGEKAVRLIGEAT